MAYRVKGWNRQFLCLAARRSGYWGDGDQKDLQYDTKHWTVQQNTLVLMIREQWSIIITNFYHFQNHR